MRDIEAELRAVLTELDAAEGALWRGNVPAREIPDFVQRVRIAAWQALQRGQLDTSDKRRVRGWFRVVGRRFAETYHDKKRQRKQRPRIVLCEDVERAGSAQTLPSPEDLALEQSPFVAVADALAALAVAHPEWHAVITVYEPGRKGEAVEAARGLGMAPGTFWNRVRLARTWLQNYFDREEARRRSVTVRRALAGKARAA